MQPDRLDPDTLDIDELMQRLLTIQALETARCFEEGVLTDVREADVGAIFGFGYAPYTGGPLSYIDTLGAAAFRRTLRALCRALWRTVRTLRAAARHGGQGRRVLHAVRNRRDRKEIAA